MATPTNNTTATVNRELLSHFLSTGLIVAIKDGEKRGHVMLRLSVSRDERRQGFNFPLWGGQRQTIKMQLEFILIAMLFFNQ